MATVSYFYRAFFLHNSTLAVFFKAQEQTKCHHSIILCFHLLQQAHQGDIFYCNDKIFLKKLTFTRYYTVRYRIIDFLSPGIFF